MDIFTNLHLFPEIQREIDDRKQRVEELYVRAGNDLAPIIQCAHEKTMQDAMARSQPNFWRAYYANNMSWNVLDAVYGTAANKVRRDAQNRPYYVISDNVRGYFKMLGPRFKPKGIITRNVQEMNTNDNTLFGEDMIIVYFGWRIRQDKQWDALSGTYMVEMATTQIPKWVSDLSDASSRFGSIPTIITLPVTGAGDGLDVSVITGMDELTGTI